MKAAHALAQIRGQTCVQLGISVHTIRFWLFPFRSPLLGEYCKRLVSSRPRMISRDKMYALFFSFPLGTEMFHFPRFPRNALCIQAFVLRVYLRGFPHSDISGSKLICQLPETFRRLSRPSSALHCQAIHHTPLRASTIRALIEMISGWRKFFQRCTLNYKSCQMFLRTPERCLAHIYF